MNVLAAPNRSSITARIRTIEAVAGQSKWYLNVDVIDAVAIEGGLFVRTGDSARVFTVGAEPPLGTGDVFRAEVEYIGGSGRGDLQLLRLDEVQPRG